MGTPAVDTVALPWAERCSSLVGSVIDSSTALLQQQKHDIVRFAMGSPAAEAIPTELLDELSGKALREYGAASFDYAATEGDPALRTALLDVLAATPESTTSDRLLVTSGGMQGLDLASKLFINPGDLVAVEAPTYTNGTATVLSYGARVLEVPVDEDGMRVEELPELVERFGPPRVIYTIPNFQNPSGTTLSLPRRRLLLELAGRWGSVVIDDDPYGWLRFSGDDLPSLRELGAGNPLVVSVRTFSKILAPGLRVGWVDADPRVIRRMINAKQAMDTCTNLPAQLLVAEFLAGGHLADHLVGLRPEYRRRKEAMQDALRQHLPFARFTDPDGGFFLWLTLPDEVDTSALFDVALAEGVAFIPGRALSASGAFGNSLRLCFASTDPARSLEGVQRLARAVHSVH
ncbi:PLP-dependent aminotransferase family protein [Actinocrispum wychmicini]|uniref:2-aminoadipate transaminase n=1 Tax=Actinocrispum wychmicini TaxID=1213861 RepID=A0A4R2J5Y5_9PSEU|nr:PLP-dependent aminotransferase family protein [Actinocrispum wychmicini]TCO54353.1 2-aminoadipate transaminase [Actinocrispum wychmicini]